MKRIGVCSFGISNKEFPIIKFSSNKQGREENVSSINKEKFLKAAKFLYDNGDYENSLLIHIMWSLASRPNEMVTLRFEDFSKIIIRNLYYTIQTRRIKERESQLQVIYMTK